MELSEYIKYLQELKKQGFVAYEVYKEVNDGHFELCNQPIEVNPKRAKLLVGEDKGIILV